MENLSPMLQQYLSMKKEVSDTLLFFRLGDFYEVFFDDAITVANELDLVLTARAAGNSQKAPMCGVPHHAISSYLQRLITKGYKVAIAEQMEDPQMSKGLVKREIVKIVTPGLNLDQEENAMNQVASIVGDLTHYHVVFFDLNTNHTQELLLPKDKQILLLTLLQYNAVEVVCDDEELMTYFRENSSLVLTRHRIKESNDPQKDVKERLLSYIEFTQKQKVQPINQKVVINTLAIDYNSATNLELTKSLRQQTKKNSLWHFLDKTQTSMGSRLLREWILNPLIDVNDILIRQQQISYLVDDFLVSHQLGQQLNNIADIHKITTKISYQNANAHDLIKLKTSLEATTQCQTLLEQGPFEVLKSMPRCEKIIQKIAETLSEDAPALIKDGNTINDGVSKDLDVYRQLTQDSNQWLLAYEQQQKELTKIKNLKVGYSRSFGYFIEVSKGQIGLVDEAWGYIARQTLTNAQRYVTIELREQEEKIANSQQRSLELEQQIFNDLLHALLKDVALLDEVASIISSLDAIYSLSEVSKQPGYVKPEFHQERIIDVTNSVHPMLQMSRQNEDIIPNDIQMNQDEDVMIITGPNMGGKSTYMRQVALIVIMAQMGCYVPASKARLPIFDAIFTRMGAGDDILMGQSTFMVEMNEAHYALARATKNSLILFDEIGRGTSTYDGMAIAKAIIEYIATHLKAKCLFSTHYHEITSLEESNSNVINRRVGVLEEKDKITFLYHVLEGKANKSYGIHVAKLANLPYPVIQKAIDNLAVFENGNGSITSQTISVNERKDTVNHPLLDQLKHIDIESITPLKAHAILAEVIDKLKGDNHE